MALSGAKNTLLREKAKIRMFPPVLRKRARTGSLSV